MNCNKCNQTAELYYTEYGQSGRVPMCRTCATGKAQFGMSESIATVDRRERPEAEKIAEEIAELVSFKAEKQKTLDSWRNWFAQGGEEDIASPVSGREIIGYCEADIAKTDNRLEKLR